MDATDEALLIYAPLQLEQALSLTPAVHSVVGEGGAQQQFEANKECLPNAFDSQYFV